MIGCFYTDEDVDYRQLTGFREQDQSEMGPMEHHRWLQEHLDMGWGYMPQISTEGLDKPTKSAWKGAMKNLRELLRRHWDMLPGKVTLTDHGDLPMESALDNYKRLNKEEQDKDLDPMDCMLAMMDAFEGIHIYQMDNRER